MAYAPSMRKLLLAVCSLVALAGCAHGPYESAFEDGGYRLSPRAFNTGNSGTDECPGELLGHASQGSATCDTAPQRCRVSPAPGGLPIMCQCNAGATGTAGAWTCR